MTSPNAGPGQAVVPPDPAAPEPAVAARAGGVPAGPLLPEQSREDTDAAWGEYPESADDRLYRDRPPHWDDHF